jgi:dolichol kinase
MNSVLISLIMGAGCAALAYAKLGRRVGYGNSGSVWGLVAVSFVAGFLVTIILLKTLVSLD